MVVKGAAAADLPSRVPRFYGNDRTNNHFTSEHSTSHPCASFSSVVA